MHFCTITLGKQMSNYNAPCFYRIDFIVVPSYIELPLIFLLHKLSFSLHQQIDFSFGLAL